MKVKEENVRGLFLLWISLFLIFNQRVKSSLTDACGLSVTFYWPELGYVATLIPITDKERELWTNYSSSFSAGHTDPESNQVSINKKEEEMATEKKQAKTATHSSLVGIVFNLEFCQQSVSPCSCLKVICVCFLLQKWCILIAHQGEHRIYRRK